MLKEGMSIHETFDQGYGAFLVISTHCARFKESCWQLNNQTILILLLLTTLILCLYLIIGITISRSRPIIEILTLIRLLGLLRLVDIVYQLLLLLLLLWLLFATLVNGSDFNQVERFEVFVEIQEHFFTRILLLQWSYLMRVQHSLKQLRLGVCFLALSVLLDCALEVRLRPIRLVELLEVQVFFLIHHTLIIITHIFTTQIYQHLYQHVSWLEKVWIKEISNVLRLLH